MKVGLPKSHNLEIEDDDLGSTSNTFHRTLEPSILSFFEDSSAEEVRKEILYAFSTKNPNHNFGFLT